MHQPLHASRESKDSTAPEQRLVSHVTEPRPEQNPAFRRMLKLPDDTKQGVRVDVFQ